MAPTVKPASPLFLGLELATDQLRATLVDEHLDLIGVESCDFDSDLPDYGTQGGIYTTPGDAYTTPIMMWVEALDIILEKLHDSHDLSRIKAIGGSAQSALVFWSTPFPDLRTASPRLRFTDHLRQLNSLALPNTSTSLDNSATTHALAIETALGGPDRMAQRVGTAAHPALPAARLLQVRETRPEVWASTRRVQTAPAFLASLLLGSSAALSESDACATGMWTHSPTPPGANPPLPGSGQGSRWDDAVLDVVGGSRAEGSRIREWLGSVETSGGAGGGKRLGTVSTFVAERYGFDPDTIVTQFMSDTLASYLSLCPSPGDAVLSFGGIDALLTPAAHHVPSRLCNVLPHPAQDASEKRKYIAQLSSRNADVPRALVRDMYTKSWSAFDRLVAITPPGGSIGLDDKLFSFWLLQGDAHPFQHTKGIFRFESGVKTHEFRDLRANPRCLVESQLLSLRIRWARMLSTGVLGSPSSYGRAKNAGVAANTSTPRAPVPSNAGVLSSLGLPFDAYDANPLPARVLVTGAAANFPAVANLVGDVFAAPVFCPNTQIDSAHAGSPHRNAPAHGFPARAALGGAYVARWVWGRVGGAGVSGAGAGIGRGGYEDEVRRLLGKRWLASSGAPPKTNVVGAPPTAVASLGNAGNGSGAATPTLSYRRAGAGGVMGSPLVEEEEEEEDGAVSGALVAAQAQGSVAPRFPLGGPPLAGMGFAEEDMTRSRSVTANSQLSALSGVSGSTAYTTPDVSMYPSIGPSGIPSGEASGTSTPGGGTTSASAGGAVSTTVLVPVVPLPTAEAEAQLGLAKVAEPDMDAFAGYGALVPEYCRLESMLVRGLF